MADIMKQVHDNPLAKDIEALIKAFGRSEAWRTFELLNESPARLKELGIPHEMIRFDGGHEIIPDTLRSLASSDSR